MSQNIAFVFPGQGSQTIGMLKEFANEPVVTQTFEEASEALGQNLWQLSQEGPESKLNDTRWTQPALLTASVALWRLWQNQTHTLPKFLAGHSLGEYSALVCAQSLTLTEGVQLVHKRGEFMVDAVPEGQGAMAAILGLNKEDVINLCQRIASQKSDWVCQAVNFNAPTQIVVAGHKAAVEAMAELAKQEGASRAIVLPVSVPSHCSLMQPAAEKLKAYIEDSGIQFKTPEFSIFHNVDVQSHASHDAILSILVQQLFQPVRWVETIEKMVDQKVDALVECGAGAVLSGLTKRIARRMTCLNLSTQEGFEKSCEFVAK